MKKSNRFCLILLLSFKTANILAQEVSGFDTTPIFDEANRFLPITDFDKSILNDEFSFTPYINTLENWQQTNSCYFAPQVRNELLIDIGLSTILLNKLSNYSYSTSENFTSATFQLTTNQVLTQYLNSTIHDKKLQPLAGQWLGAFEYGKSYLRSNTGTDISVSPYENIFVKKANELGNIKVNSDVDDCAIFLDEEDTEFTTNRTIVVKVGSRQVTVKKEGYEDCNTTVEVKKRSTKTVDCKMIAHNN